VTDFIWFKPNPEAEAFKLRIRSPLECAPDRAFKRGGRFQIHPKYSLLADEETTLTEDPSEWNLISIRSIEPKVHTTFNRVQPTFSDYDLKSRRTQTGESHHEFNNYIWRAADPDIVDLQLGGLQLSYEHEGGPRTYTADCVYLTADGHLFADEVKASNSYFNEPDYKARLKRVEADLAAVGIGFNRVVASHVRELRVRRHNLTRAFLDRHANFRQRSDDGGRRSPRRRPASSPANCPFDALPAQAHLRARSADFATHRGDAGTACREASRPARDRPVIRSARRPASCQNPGFRHA
jgi:hypothetical protein